MTADNLGIVWGPTLLRQEQESFLGVDLPAQVVGAMIKHCSELFSKEVG